jgi:hypothetical protein
MIDDDERIEVTEVYAVDASGAEAVGVRLWIAKNGDVVREGSFSASPFRVLSWFDEPSPAPKEQA